MPRKIGKAGKVAAQLGHIPKGALNIQDKPVSF